MKPWLVYLFWVCTYVSVNGQCYFHDIYWYGANIELEVGHSVKQTKDGGLIACGLTYNLSDGALFVVRTDACGDTIWKRAFDLSLGVDRGYSIVEVSNGYLVLGYLYDTIEQQSNCYLSKIDINGDLDWVKDINLGLNDRGKALLDLGADGFVFTGFYNVIPPNAKVFLVKTDTLGNVEWQHDYGDSAKNLIVNALDRTLDGGYIISGRLGNPATQAYELFLIRTDSLGNQLWFESYGDQNWAGQGRGGATLDGGFIIAGYKEIDPPDDYRAYIVKADANGDVEWERLYGEPYVSLIFKNILQNSDSTYLVYGSLTDTTTLNINAQYVYLAELNLQGDVLWKRTYTYYGQRTHNYAENLIVTSEGDFVITGQIIPVGLTIGTKNDVFILKTDSCGYTVGDTTLANFALDSVISYEAYFNNTSTKVCGSIWYFGDGDSSIHRSPTHTYADTGTYTVTLITAAGNTTDTITQTITIEQPTGLGYINKSQQRVSIYPNPASGQITIDYDLGKRESDFVMYDLYGREVHRQTLNDDNATTHVDATLLGSGVYLYRVVQSGQQLKMGRLVIVR